MARARTGRWSRRTSRSLCATRYFTVLRPPPGEHRRPQRSEDAVAAGPVSGRRTEVLGKHVRVDDGALARRRSLVHRGLTRTALGGATVNRRGRDVGPVRVTHGDVEVRQLLRQGVRLGVGGVERGLAGVGQVLPLRLHHGAQRLEVGVDVGDDAGEAVELVAQLADLVSLLGHGLLHSGQCALEPLERAGGAVPAVAHAGTTTFLWGTSGPAEGSASY